MNPFIHLIGHYARTPRIVLWVMGVLVFTIGLLPNAIALHGSGNEFAENLETNILGGTTISIGSATVPIGEPVCIPMTANGFQNINTWQATLTFDPAILQFDDVQNTLLPGLILTETAPGELFLFWMGEGGGTITFPDETVLFEICFTAIGGGESVVDFAEGPFPFQLFDGNFFPVIPILSAGSVTVESTILFEAGIDATTIGNSVCIPITADFFSAASFFPAMRIVFDENIVSFTGVQNVNLPGLDAADIVAIGPGLLQLPWASPDGQIVDLPNETILFEVCFDGLSLGQSPIDLFLATEGVLDNDENSVNFIVENGFVFVYDPSSDDCNATTLTATALATDEGECCWQLNLTNFNPTLELFAVEVIALNSETFDFTLNSGAYFAPNYDANSVLISPEPIGALPFTQEGLLEICFPPSPNAEKELLIKYYDNQFQVVCQNNLTVACEVGSDCMDVLDQTVTCQETGGFDLSMTLRAPFFTGQPITRVKLNIVSPLELEGEYVFDFPVPLFAGEQVPIQIPLPIANSIPLFEELCVILTAHNGPAEELCCTIYEGCIPVEHCDPCPEVLTQLIPNADGDCCFDVTISNNYVFEDYFGNIQLDFITSGFSFDMVSFPQDSPWNSLLTPDNSGIRLIHESGFVPSDLTDEALFSFCLNDTMSIDSILLNSTWVGQNETCTETVSFICQDCFLRTNSSVICNELETNYQVRIQGINKTADCTANVVRLVNNSTEFTTSTTIINLGTPVAPEELYSLISFDVFSDQLFAGDIACVDLVFENHLPDGTIIECCTTPYCFVIPACDFQEDICTCNDLEEDAFCGFSMTSVCYDLTVTPLCLIDDCDEVAWALNGESVGTSSGTAAFTFSVPDDGNYHITMNVMRMTSSGIDCQQSFTDNTSILCEDPDCEDIACTPPDDANINCEDLPADFDATDTSDLQGLFGNAILDTDCPTATLTELAPNVVLDGCGEGTIVRTFEVDNGSGLTATCTQTIIIGNSGGPIDYAIKFPPDGAGLCAVVTTLQPEVFTQGCADIAIMIEEEFVDPPLFNQCNTVQRTIRIINWCEYDGVSDPVVISRDEACFDDEGSEETWVILIDGVTYTDNDDNPFNNIPNQGESEADCFGVTNPMGYWRNSNDFPELTSVGYWEYTQFASYSSTPVVMTIPDDYNLCIDNDSCFVVNTFPITIDNHCVYSPATINFFYDENSDGVEDVIADIGIDGTVSTILGNPAFVEVTGTLPDYTFIVDTTVVGTHLFTLRGVSDCGVGFSQSFTLTVEDCEAPVITCEAGFTADIVAGIPPIATVNATDLAVDFIDITDCTSPVSFSINRTGSAVDPMQSSIDFGCADLGIQSVDVHVWDGAGNSNTCTVDVIIEDPLALCQQPLISEEPGILLRPNPATSYLLIESTHSGSAEMFIMNIGNKVVHQESVHLDGYAIQTSTNELQAGMYIIQLHFEDGVRQIASFIKL